MTGRATRSAMERRTAVEAMAVLVAASLAVRFLPFRTVARLSSRRVTRPAPADPAQTIALVAWAVGAAARRARFRAVCIEQGVAAQLMLRRRGIDSTMYYGAANRPDEGLAAHVWVRHGAIDVVGCEEAPGFALLASFP